MVSSFVAFGDFTWLICFEICPTFVPFGVFSFAVQAVARWSASVAGQRPLFIALVHYSPALPGPILSRNESLDIAERGQRASDVAQAASVLGGHNASSRDSIQLKIGPGSPGEMSWPER